MFYFTIWKISLGKKLVFAWKTFSHSHGSQPVQRQQDRIDKRGHAWWVRHTDWDYIALFFFLLPIRPLCTKQSLEARRSSYGKFSFLLLALDCAGVFSYSGFSLRYVTGITFALRRFYYSVLFVAAEDNRFIINPHFWVVYTHSTDRLGDDVHNIERVEALIEVKCGHRHTFDDDVRIMAIFSYYSRIDFWLNTNKQID